jgi:hypothetical protein
MAKVPLALFFHPLRLRCIFLKNHQSWACAFCSLNHLDELPKPLQVFVFKKKDVHIHMVLRRSEKSARASCRWGEGKTKKYLLMFFCEPTMTLFKIKKTNTPKIQFFTLDGRSLMMTLPRASWYSVAALIVSTDEPNLPNAAAMDCPGMMLYCCENPVIVMAHVTMPTK